MTVATLVARIFSVGLLIIGISHLLQAGLWRSFFITIKRTGFAGFIIAMFTLPQGLLIALGHNIWVLGIPVIITFFGWAMILKSVIYLLFPEKANASIPEGPESHKKYALVGALMIPVSILLIWHSFFRAQ